MGGDKDKDNQYHIHIEQRIPQMANSISLLAPLTTNCRFGDTKLKLQPFRRRLGHIRRVVVKETAVKESFLTNIAMINLKQ